MIQRIQTVFLVLVVLAGVLVFFFPIAIFISDAGYFKFFIHGVHDLVHDPFFVDESGKQTFSFWFTAPLMFLQIFIILLAAYAIFQFKKRILQIRLNVLNVFLNVILVGSLFFYSSMIENRVGVKPDYALGVIFPLISIILMFLANRFIKMDERLIRSADRLR